MSRQEKPLVTGHHPSKILNVAEISEVPRINTAEFNRAYREWEKKRGYVEPKRKKFL